MTISPDWFERLPVRTSSSSGSTFHDQHLTRCGVSVHLAGARHRVLGHGSSPEPEHALTSATWELRERVLMIAEVTGEPDRIVHGTPLHGDSRQSARFIDVVARPWHPTYKPGRDATGLAIQTERSSAVTAALDELVERSLNARLWYASQGLSVAPAEVPEGALTYARTSLRAWSSPVNINGVDRHYALCAIENGTKQILVCGSAVRGARASAVAHARDEAVMIYESVSEGRAARYHSTSSHVRFSSLRGGAHAARAQHLEKRVSAEGEPALFDPRGVVMWDLVQGDGVHLVRATARDMGSELRRWRERRNPEVPDDPFV